MQSSNFLQDWTYRQEMKDVFSLIEVAQCTKGIRISPVWPIVELQHLRASHKNQSHLPYGEFIPKVICCLQAEVEFTVYCPRHRLPRPNKTALEHLFIDDGNALVESIPPKVWAIYRKAQGKVVCRGQLIPVPERCVLTP